MLNRQRFACAAADCSNQLNHKDKIASVVLNFHIVMSIWLKLVNAIGTQTRDELKTGDGVTTLQNGMNEHTTRPISDMYQ
jgi:hypothetical protein